MPGRQTNSNTNRNRARNAQQNNTQNRNLEQDKQDESPQGIQQSLYGIVKSLSRPVFTLVLLTLIGSLIPFLKLTIDLYNQSRANIPPGKTYPELSDMKITLLGITCFTLWKFLLFTFSKPAIAEVCRR